jgi:hypothetical protein
MKRDLALWITVLAGPVLWLCAFLADFALHPFACIFQSKLALLGVYLAGIVLSLVSAFWAHRLWREVGPNFEVQDSGAIPRSRAMSIAGMAFGVGFAMVMFAQLIPILLLGACE